MISFQQIKSRQSTDHSGRIELSTDNEKGSNRFELAIQCLGSEIGRIIAGICHKTYYVYDLAIPQERHWVLLETIIEALISHSKERFIKHMVVFYFAEKSCLKQIWVKMLQKYGCSNSPAWSHHFIASPSVFAPRWLELRLGKEFEVRPWIELEGLVNQSILSGCLNSRVIPDDQLPVIDGVFVNHNISQGLLFNGKLVGWIQAWRDERKPKHMAIRILYVDTPLQKRGVGIRFLATFLKSFPCGTQYHFCVLDQNRAMLNFSIKHMGSSFIRNRIRYRAIIDI